MGIYYVLLGWLLLFSGIANCQSHGLQFSSYEVVPEKRTALNVTSSEPLCLSDNTQIAFDLNFTPNFETYFGYIVRIITTNKQNIDIVYNQRLRNFNFVIGELFSSVFKVDSSKLFGDWSCCNIRFDKKSQQVFFYLNGIFICKAKFNFTNATCCNIFFGINDFEGFKTIDVPPMRIKDVAIKEGKNQRYFFPLSESSGNMAEDIVEKKLATVKNPVWIKPKHQNWQKAFSFKTTATASVAFDKKREILYVVSKIFIPGFF